MRQIRVSTTALVAVLVVACVLFSPPDHVSAVLPPTFPPWAPTYNMSLSMLTMAVNSSGWSRPELGARFGITSYDWSNAKAQWAAAKPMDCNERLAMQAEMTHAVNPAGHVFTYRNLVKALPWFTEVRQKLDDPQYAGFFLKFVPEPQPVNVPRCAAENPSKCSVFYHDQEQTPEVPTPSDPSPDGACAGYCDCGTQPCGEYLWNHRNGSMLLHFLLHEHLGGPLGLGHPAIDGFFIDDFWCSNVLQKQRGLSPCNDPVQGPTEIDAKSQTDMGLSDRDIMELTLAWEYNMEEAQRYILRRGGYTWSLMADQGNANAMPTLLTHDTCVSLLREACAPTSSWQQQPKLFGLTPNATGPGLGQLKQDLAFFLLARGPYTWMGWGTWGMVWPFDAEPAHGGLPPSPDGEPIPEALTADYGHPLEVCSEHTQAAGVFTRRWSKADVTLDCNVFVGDAVMVDREAEAAEERARRERARPRGRRGQQQHPRQGGGVEGAQGSSAAAPTAPTAPTAATGPRPASQRPPHPQRAAAATATGQSAARVTAAQGPMYGPMPRPWPRKPRVG